MSKDQEKRFIDRFESDRANHGLTDVKFFVRHGDSLSLEDFFAAANRIQEEIDSGRAKVVSSWHDKVKPSFSYILA